MSNLNATEYWIETSKNGKLPDLVFDKQQLSTKTGLIVHVIEYSAFEELQKENVRLKETLSYLPKVPTQPYEKELAQKYQAILAQAEMMAEALDSCMWADNERGAVSGIARKALKQWQEFKK